MAMSDIGALRAADEGLNHQIVDTFATVSQSDLVVDREDLVLDGEAPTGRCRSTWVSASTTTAGSSTGSVGSPADDQSVDRSGQPRAGVRPR